jgi:hypothetical protein
MQLLVVQLKIQGLLHHFCDRMPGCFRPQKAAASRLSGLEHSGGKGKSYLGRQKGKVREPASLLGIMSMKASSPTDRTAR